MSIFKQNYSSTIFIIRKSQREDINYMYQHVKMLAKPGIEPETLPFPEGRFDS